MRTLATSRHEPVSVAGDRSAGDRPRARASWIEAATATVATRVMLVAVAYAAAWFLASTEGPLQVSFVDMWDNWDARLFAIIAEDGYFGPDRGLHATAFFPLYPLLMRAVGATGLNLIVAGMIISFVSTVVAGTYLHRLVEEEVGEGSGRHAVLYLLLFPTAVFLVAPYSEALFLAGAIPAFYYARRSRWLLAGAFAAVAMGARFAGAFVLIGLAVEFLRQRDFSLEKAANALTGLVVGALPFLAYAAYLAQTTGNPFHFVLDQREGWGRQFVGPINSFLNTYNTWEGADYPTNWRFAWRVEILAAAVGVGFVIWAVTKREWGYGAYMGTFLAVLVTSSWYYSIPRMLLSFWPALVFLAAFARGGRARHEYVLILLIPLATLGAVVFTRGAWFY